MLGLVSSCSQQNNNKETGKFKEINFELKGFEWDPPAYNFSQFILDSVVHNRGAQYAAWDFSYVGNIKKMHEMWDSQGGPQKDVSQVKKDSFALYKRIDAIPYILDEAKKHQVVVINEGHHMPQHRVFTTRLLSGLKAQGYKHLGLETYFSSKKTDASLKANGYPTLQSGYYTKEPQFGNLVREAHRLGFKIFGYESSGHANGKEREINQAKNIQAYLEKHPNEKALIHCGFAHAYEGVLGGKWEKAMAGRLTEFTGIDPLSICQTDFSEHSERQYEHPYYQLTDVKEPSIYQNDSGETFDKPTDNGWYDISIFHPRSREEGRPQWMIYDDRSVVDFTFADADIACPCLVLAYKNGEEIGVAVPYDVQETDTTTAQLVLDQSDYDIVIWNQEGKALRTRLSR